MVLCLFLVASPYRLSSPDGRITVTVAVDSSVSYSVQASHEQLLAPSSVSLGVSGSSRIFKDTGLKRVKYSSHHGVIRSFAYKKELVGDDYNALTLFFDHKYQIQFRTYNDGVAYRFVYTGKSSFAVNSERAEFNFPHDWPSYIPYTNSTGTLEEQMITSFENTYSHTPLSGMDSGHIAFLPILVETDSGAKVCITEANVENYPGMFLLNPDHGLSLKGMFARYPKETEQGGHNMLQETVKSRESYLVQCHGSRSFPWRVLCISSEDRQLLDNDMVYRLASPSRVEDTSWIRPGKVAWDWWNDWGLYSVGFKSGINTETYKYYIDFASKYGIEYLILDEGWSVMGKADLMQVIPQVNLRELVDYGRRKGVGIILWAGYYAFDRDLENVCRHYSSMGVKGFKIDFMDRDDAACTDFLYRAASTAAKYHLILDFHGTCKPSGLNRTYPNVLNFEGVAGQERDKWSTIEQYDQVNYDVSLPYLRQVSGPMDYTPGAMLNGTRSTFRPCYSIPMSQGTRCHQLAEYVVFFSPLNMLCDSPTRYERERECTDFISGIPTVWDESLPLAGKVGQYAAIARRKGNAWYVAVLNNWTERDVTLNLKFLSGRTATVFRDGANADRIAEDYVKDELSVPSDGQLTVHLAPGGGYVMRIR